MSGKNTNRVVSYLPDDAYEWLHDLIEEKSSSESVVIRELLVQSLRKAKGKK